MFPFYLKITDYISFSKKYCSLFFTVYLETEREIFKLDVSIFLNSKFGVGDCLVKKKIKRLLGGKHFYDFR